MKLKNNTRLKVVLFYNGEKGKFILKKINSLKNILIKKVVVINKELIKEEKNKFFKKKYILIKKLNTENSRKILKKIASDIFIIAGFPIILKKKIFNIPKQMTINLHGGPLPQYRGGSPLNWQIINKEKNIGISIIKVDEGIDTGELLAQTRFNLSIKDDIKTVHKKANTLFFKLLKNVLIKISNKKLKIKKQNNITKYKYWKQRSDLDGSIHLKKKTAQDIEYHVKALTKPYPGAWVKLDGNKKLRIFKLKVLEKNILKKKGEIKKIKQNLFIRSKDKTFKVIKYKYE